MITMGKNEHDNILWMPPLTSENCGVAGSSPALGTNGIGHQKATKMDRQQCRSIFVALTPKVLLTTVRDHLQLAQHGIGSRRHSRVQRVRSTGSVCSFSNF